MILDIRQASGAFAQRRSAPWFPRGRSFPIALAAMMMAVLWGLAGEAAAAQTLVVAKSQLCVGVAANAQNAGANVTQMDCGSTDSTGWVLDSLDNGYYHIVRAGSGQCLNVPYSSTAPGTQLIQYSCQAASLFNDQWRLETVGANYRLVSRLNGLCANVDGGSTAAGARIIQWPCQGATSLNDQFRVISPPVLPSLPVGMRVASSGLCVGVPGGSTTATEPMRQMACSGGLDNQWQLRELGNGYHHLVLLSSGQCLNVNQGSRAAGAALIQWPCQGLTTNNDQWRIERAAGDNYRVVSRSSGLCLNVESGSTATGAGLIQWPCQSNALLNDQVAFVEPAGASLPSRWSSVIPLPVNPIAVANLPDGRLMMWSTNQKFSYQGDAGYANTLTRYAIFDPATNTAGPERQTTTGVDMFCPGTAMLPDGRLLVNGGSSSPKTSLYDWRSDTWTTAATMNVPRGYQGDTLLSDGSVFTLGGSWSGGQGNKTGEVWSAATGWKLLSGVPATPVVATDPQGVYRGDNHLWLFAQSNGTVFHAGPSPQMNWISTTGNGAVQGAGTRAGDGYSMNGNAVLFDVGQILKVGGAPAYQQNFSTPTYATNTAYTIDIRGGYGTTPTVRKLAGMQYQRAMSTAVVLPNGNVVVIGGQSIPEPFTDTSAILIPEIWDPATGAFMPLAAMRTPRTYHSTAILLHDGRVFVGGGGQCGTGCVQNHLDAEILTPPYLLNQDGSAAARPAITSAPGVAQRGQSIVVTTNSPVATFALMRLSAVTHTTNTDPRRSPLAAEQIADRSYRLTIPSDSGVVLPGYYMLFAMNAAGVPSVASSVQVP